MATQTRPTRRRRTTRFRSTAPTTSSSTSATRSRRRISTRPRSASSSSAYRGPETGVRDRASYLLVQNKIRLVLTSPLGPDGEIADHVRQHGDGVRDIALWVDDARDAHAEGGRARRRVRGTSRARCATTTARSSSPAIKIYGDTIHSLVERQELSRRCSCPASSRATPRYQAEPTGLQYVDHCVGNVELGKMNEWVGFYERVMGFKNLISFDDEDISTEYSSLMSKVMSNGNERIKFPINEPATGKKKSQIDEYLDFYRGPGRAAPRARDRRHHHHGDARCAIAASSSSRRRRRTTTSSRTASARSTSRSTSSRSSASSSIAIPTATCCRSSRSRCRIGRRCSTRSSSERARGASGRGTSRRCSRRSSGSRRCEGICRVGHRGSSASAGAQDLGRQ